MFLLRVALPDRPGSLGAVATALGLAGVDIHSVEIVSRLDHEGSVVDDFMVKLPDGAMPDNAVSACTQVEGVRVLWCSRYPRTGELESDVDTLERMLDEPTEAAEILCQSAPQVFHVHWAMLIDKRENTVLSATPMAPDLTPEALAELGPFDFTRTEELAKEWVAGWPETLMVVTPVRGGRALMLGRTGGPEYLHSELARLKHLATLVPVA